MKIALLVDWHSEKMGYSDNFLPKALAKLGHEVHLISTNCQVYFNSPLYESIFKKFLGDGITKCGVSYPDNYTLHRLPHKIVRGRLRAVGMSRLLRQLKPDIVQVGELGSYLGYEAAMLKPWLGFKFFSECHTHASVFPPALGTAGRKRMLAWALYSRTVGSAMGAVTERCYPISDDAADIAERFYGISRKKITIRSLGVDTNLFHPLENEKDRTERDELRSSLNIGSDEIVAIYTGRISPEKGPSLLAAATAKLREQGERIRAVFIGDGPQEYLRAISSTSGCTVLPFVAVQSLPAFYRMADIGVWPKQESTSQLDALSCGLPLILSDKIHVTERVENCGLQYQEGNSESLAQQLKALSTSQSLRIQMGKIGSEKMVRDFSWDKIAALYASDYQNALQPKIAAQ